MTTYYRKEDVAEMLAAFGVPVQIGSSTTIGIVDRDTEEILRGASAHALGDRIEVTIETGTLDGLAIGATVVVDGTTYLVNSVKKLDDGAITQFECSVTA